MRRLFVATILTLLATMAAVAQDSTSSDSGLYRARKGYHIFFEIDRSDINRSFKSNARTLDQMKADCEATIQNAELASDTIYINASSSPDGSVAYNRELARRRALSAKNALIELVPAFKDKQFVINYQVENWNALRQILIADEAFPQRGQMLEILSGNTPQEDLHKALKSCTEGWKHFVEHYIYSLRNASVELSVVTYSPKDEFTMVQEVQAVEPQKKDTVVTEPVVTKPEKGRKPFYMAIKNNMLYDIAAIPNLGAEFYLGKNISIVGNWMYSWWKNDDIAWYWRTYGGDLGIRYWFGKAAKEKPLTGHHVGLYGQILTYDFEMGGRGYLGDRWTWGGGLEYGYSLPVAKRINIDFTIGAGYLGGEFKEYLPIDGHYVWQATKYRHWLGPTKAEISLVWLLGYGNKNEGKGGKR